MISFSTAVIAENVGGIESVVIPIMSLNFFSIISLPFLGTGFLMEFS